jgi:hypothetical protein
MTNAHNDRAFAIAENTGRQKSLAVLNAFELIEDAGYTIVPTADKYCKWDFELIEKGTGNLLGIVEVKDRKFPSNDARVVKEGVQMETPKVMALKEKANEDDIVAYYLATFSDNKAMMWDIMAAQTTTDCRMANKTTAVDNGKVLKSFHYFMPKDSIIGITDIVMA